MSHVNKKADFALRLDLRLPGQDDTTQDPEPGPADTQQEPPSLEDIEVEIYGPCADVAEELPAYSNSSYEYPCTIFFMQHSEADAPRVRAWFSGDYSGVTEPPSAELNTNLSRALDSTLKGWRQAAARAGLVTYPLRIGAALRLADGSALPLGDPVLFYNDPVAPNVIVRSYTPSSTNMLAYVEIRADMFVPMFAISDDADGEMIRRLEALRPVSVDFYATRQFPFAPDPLTCTGLRGMMVGSGDNAIRLRGFVFDAYEKEYVQARAAGDTDFRVVASVPWTGGPFPEQRIPLSEGAFANFDSMPEMTWKATAPEPDPEPEEPEPEAPAIVRWEAEVFTTDLRRAFRASMDADGTLTNAVRNPDGFFRLTVHGHGLECGPVRCRVTPWLRDKDFPLGARREPIMLATGIILWDGNTDAPELTAEVTAALPLFQGPPGPRGRDAAAQNPTRVIATHRARKGDPATNRNRYLCRVAEGDIGDIVVYVQEPLDFDETEASDIYAEVIINNGVGWNGNSYIAVWWDGEKWRGENLSVNDIPDRLPPPTEDEVNNYITHFNQRHPEGSSPVSSFRFQFQTRVRVRTQNGYKRWRWSRKVRLVPRLNKYVFRVRRIRLRAGSHDRPRHRNKIASEWVVFGQASKGWKKL